MIQIQPVILSGGSGTRLWPLSREYYPKQLLSPFGDLTLLQATLDRVNTLQDARSNTQNIKVLSPVIVCNEEHRFLVAEQLRQIDIEPESIMLEPAGRNTAPALTLAALKIAEQGQDVIMLVMPADHIIQDTDTFHQSIIEAAMAASFGNVATFGIVPDKPETGYGYIQKGKVLIDGADGTACKIESFVEKPDDDQAAQYLASGDYLWNSGMFVMQARVWLNKIGQYRPDILEACTQAYAKGKQDGGFYRVDKDSFIKSPSDSIDYAVMEKIADDKDKDTQAVVIPLDAGWSDIGAWSSLWDVMQHDGQGNIAKGDVYLHDTQDSLLISTHRLLAGLGLKDIIVVETADAVMIAHKDYAQEIKVITTRLEKEGRTEHQIHKRVHRPWGDYEGIDMGERYQVKRITVKPGASLSLQMHHHRAEHWIVVKGTAKVTRGDEEFILGENESTYISIGEKHRLENPGTLPLEIIEVQSGSYLGEDDIVRFEDIYGR